jgi:hypothetical protein
MMTKQWHPQWCAHDHTCNAGRCPAGEHRAAPIRIDLPGAGSVVLTRIRSHDTGVEHAEIRLSVRLPDTEPAARLRLASLLAHLQALIGPARTGRAQRAA